MGYRRSLGPTLRSAALIFKEPLHGTQNSNDTAHCRHHGSVNYSQRLGTPTLLYLASSRVDGAAGDEKEFGKHDELSISFRGAAAEARELLDR